MKAPLDPFPYPQDPRSRAATPALRNGCYVYARDAQGTVRVLPDGTHLHPKILGGGSPAMYAGDVTIRDGHIIDLTNLSGTFRFDEPKGLFEVADALAEQGFVIDSNAVRFFPQDGSRPVILRQT